MITEKQALQQIAEIPSVYCIRVIPNISQVANVTEP